MVYGTSRWLNGKGSPCRCKTTWVQSLGWKDPLENGVPTPVFLPENPMDRGVWQDTGHEVTKELAMTVTKQSNKLYIIYNYLYIICCIYICVSL